MGLRIGAGFRLGRHVWIGASVPLGHARRLGRHQGHGDLFDTLVGLAIMWVFLRVLGAGVGDGRVSIKPEGVCACPLREKIIDRAIVGDRWALRLMPDDVPPEVRRIARDAWQRKIVGRIGVAVFLAIWVWAVWVAQP